MQIKKRKRRYTEIRAALCTEDVQKILVREFANALGLMVSPDQIKFHIDEDAGIVSAHVEMEVSEPDDQPDKYDD